MYSSGIVQSSRIWMFSFKMAWTVIPAVSLKGSLPEAWIDSRRTSSMSLVPNPSFFSRPGVEIFLSRSASKVRIFSIGMAWLLSRFTTVSSTDLMSPMLPSPEEGGTATPTRSAGMSSGCCFSTCSWYSTLILKKVSHLSQ